MPATKKRGPQHFPLTLDVEGLLRTVSPSTRAEIEGVLATMEPGEAEIYGGLTMLGGGAQPTPGLDPFSGLPFSPSQYPGDLGMELTSPGAPPISTPPMDLGLPPMQLAGPRWPEDTGPPIASQPSATAAPMPAPTGRPKWTLGRVLEMLGEGGAAMQGRPSPVGERQKLAMAKQEMASQSALRNAQVLESSLKAVQFVNENVPAEKHEGAKAFLRQAFEGVSMTGSDGQPIPLAGFVESLVGSPVDTKAWIESTRRMEDLPEWAMPSIEAEARKAKTAADWKALREGVEKLQKQGREDFDQATRMGISQWAKQFAAAYGQAPTIADAQAELRKGPADISRRALASFGRIAADPKNLASIGIMPETPDVITGRKTAEEATPKGQAELKATQVQTALAGYKTIPGAGGAIVDVTGQARGIPPGAGMQAAPGVSVIAQTPGAGVPLETARHVSRVESVLASLKGIQKLLMTGSVDRFIGPTLTGARFNEWWAKNIPGVPVPDELTMLTQAEGMMKNFKVVDITGAAVRESEEPRIYAEIPDRTADKPEAYRLKFANFMHILSQIDRRNKELLGADGRMRLDVNPDALARKYPLSFKYGNPALTPTPEEHKAVTAPAQRKLDVKMKALRDMRSFIEAEMTAGRDVRESAIRSKLQTQGFEPMMIQDILDELGGTYGR